MSEVDRLWELQTVMSAMTEKQRGLEEKPEDFAEIDAEYGTATREMDEIRQKIETLAAARRKVELELQDEQEILKKYQGQLMQVKNQTQYAAAWKEIDATRRKVKELEDATLASMTQTDALQTDLDSRQENYTLLKERYDAAYAEWQGSLSGLRSDIDKLKSKAAEIETGIPQNIRAQFHTIFKHRQGIAVASVTGGACTACRVRIRPQVLQQLKRGELIICEGCKRFSYLEGVNA